MAGVSGTAVVSVTATDDGSPAGVGTYEFTVNVYPISALHGGWENIMSVGQKTNLSDENIGNAGYVKLDWGAFTLVGSSTYSGVGIAGYHVFRRTTGEEYDYNDPLNGVNTPVASSTTEYTDSTVEAGTVYYYKVTPIDNANQLIADTEEVYNEVRVVAAPNNKVFIHRWMMNKEVCEKMFLDVEEDSNYRCAFAGPGDSGGSGYFDIGSDLLVDQVEMGCPFSRAHT